MKFQLSMVAATFAAMTVAADVSHSSNQQSEMSAATVTNEAKLIKFGKKMVTREYAQETIARVKAKRTGGTIRKPESASGWFVLVNAQSIVPHEGFDGALQTIARQVKIQTKSCDVKSVKVDMARDVISAAGGQIGVVLVDDSSLPALLGAPEEGWGMVNVAKIKGANAETTAARTRREILRAFGLAAGAMYAAQGDFVLQPVRKSADLDALQREEFGAMMLHIYPLSLPYYGITPWHQTTYLNACQEGWAPQPTNEYQKAIWDQVHAVPANPMKIEFDPKKGR